MTMSSLGQGLGQEMGERERDRERGGGERAVRVCSPPGFVIGREAASEYRTSGTACVFQNTHPNPDPTKHQHTHAHAFNHRLTRECRAHGY